MPSADPLHHTLLAWAQRAGEHASTARRRQLTWVAGELSRYAATLPSPPTADQLLSDEHVTPYLTAAAAGALRARQTRHTASSAASLRVRCDCLRMLAAAGGLPTLTLDPPAPPPPRTPAPARDVRETAGALAVDAHRGRKLAAAARQALAVALVADTGMRTGELVDLRVEDVDVDAASVRYRPRPQAARAPRDVVVAQLSPATVRAVRVWLEHREQLTALTPRTRALFVSVHGNHNGAGTRRPAGLPMQARGLARAHRAAAASLNARRATRELVPATLGDLRPAPPSPAGEPGSHRQKKPPVPGDSVGSR